MHLNLNLFPDTFPVPRKIPVTWQFLAKEQCDLGKLVDKQVLYAVWLLLRTSHIPISTTCPGVDVSLKYSWMSS